jgi:zeaxanthin glucosyltransferase
MATIAFLIESDKGHLHPTFWLARQLAARGHRPVYLGFADQGGIVRQQGFEYVPILGYLSADTTPSSDSAYDRSWRALLDDHGLDLTVADLQPALFVLTSFCAPHALVLHNRYHLPAVLLNPILRTAPKSDYAVMVSYLVQREAGSRERFKALLTRNGSAPQRSAELAPRVLAQLLRMRELILCPGDFELPELRRDTEPEVHYVEASVDLDRREDGQFPLEALDPARRLLYVCIGSSGRMERRNAAHFLQAVTAAFSDRPDWQVVVTTGGVLEPGGLTPPPGGIVTSWAPQLQLLGRAAVAVTQGGLGTLKECILHDVPMVVFPLDGDQLDNARRVVRHGLGTSGDWRAVSPNGIAALVATADRQAVRENVRRMRQRFLEVEHSAISVRLIEDLLSPAPRAVA